MRSTQNWQPLAAREAVVLADAHSSEYDSLARVWAELTAGISKVSDSFCSENRCYVVLTPPSPQAPFRLSERRRRCLERLLLGEQQKVVAEELRLSRSLFSSELGNGLSALGIARHSTRVPMLLAMAYRASRGERVRRGRFSCMSCVGGSAMIVSVARPDQQLAARLSPAECTVAKLFLDGCSHAEIARQRRTSVRTIANQLAATFHKLGVSGRTQLISYVLQAPPVDAAI